MANASKLPTLTEMVITQLSRADFELPSLQDSLNATDVTSTVKLNGIAKKADGTILTGGMLIGVETDDGFIETIWLPAGSSADGQTFTSAVRGIDRGGLDYTVGDSSQVTAHRSGARVFCTVSAVLENLLRSALQGTIATGGNSLNVGTEVGSETVTFYRTTTAGNKLGFFRWYITSGKVEFSNDGSTWQANSDVSASNLVAVTSSDTTASYLDSKIDVATDGELTKSVGNPAGNETLRLGLATTLTKAEMDALHTGISANVTGTNLATLTAGPASNADALHTHLQVGNVSYTAYEAISQYDAVCLLPIQVEFFAQLTDANLALGDSNVRRKHAIKFIPTATTSTLTTMLFRASEAVNGATTLGNLTISIQTDSAGAPSGTAISNGTANVITQVTQRTWTTSKANRTATWAASPTLTAGTTYWLVFEVASTDATNYLNISVNSSHDEDYLTFTRLTYNLDTATWGTSTTNATPFFWFNNQTYLTGHALAKCDANFGGRTWSFIGFAPSAIAAQASGTVNTDTATQAAVVTNGKPYYLSTTAGLITQTAPQSFYNAGSPAAFCYKVAEPLTSTTVKVSPGEKFIWGTLSNTAATTTQQIIWFTPKKIEIDGAVEGTSNSQLIMSSGVYDGTNNYSMYGSYEAAATTDVGIDAAVSLGTSALAGDYFTGVCSGLTDAGFTFATTEGGTAVGYALIWKAYA